MKNTNVSDAICAFVRLVSFIKKGTRKKTVDEKEVVRFYTEVFRNPEEIGLKPADSMKAAEFFSKYYSMLDKAEEADSNVVIIDDIRSEERE